MPYRRFPFLNLFSPFFPLRQGQAPLLGGSSHAPYRFGEMIQKAEPCADVKALGRAMLAALGRKGGGSAHRPGDHLADKDVVISRYGYHRENRAHQQ